MGVEALAPVVLMLGVALFVFLVARSLDAAARSYALPTLLAAVGFAVFLNSRDGHAHGYFWSSLIAWFALGAFIFGAHAHVIRWLVKRQAAFNFNPRRQSPTGKREDSALRSVLEDFLNGRLGVTETVRSEPFSRSMHGRDRNLDLGEFFAVAAATRDFPLGPCRQYWAPAALARYDAKRLRVESQYFERSREASKAVLQYLNA